MLKRGYADKNLYNKLLTKKGIKDKRVQKLFRNSTKKNETQTYPKRKCLKISLYGVSSRA